MLHEKQLDAARRYAGDGPNADMTLVGKDPLHDMDVVTEWFTKALREGGGGGWNGESERVAKLEEEAMARIQVIRSFRASSLSSKEKCIDALNLKRAGRTSPRTHPSAKIIYIPRM